MSEEKKGLFDMLDKHIPATQNQFLFQSASYLIMLFGLVIVIGSAKLVLFGGQANIFGNQINFTYTDHEDNSSSSLTQGVTDIGETRIQWGTFTTGEDWKEIKFLKPFRDANIAISVSTSDSPIHFYPLVTRDLTQSGFEVAVKAEEADPIFTQYMKTENGRIFTEEDMRNFGAANFVAKEAQIRWIFGLSGLPGNYMAIGLVPYD